MNFYQDSRVTLHCGDAITVLREFPAASVQCCITSPPYWGLRDYSVDGQLGLEETPELYVAHMVEVFREVKRVLRDDGTLWCNLGDAFLNKQLLGMPWKVAFALQADGWYLRADIIWAKPNPMPESVTDRPTKAHEYLFLLSKRERYYYDAEAIKEPLTAGSIERGYTKAKFKNGLAPKNTQIGNHVGFAITEVPSARNRRSVWTIATEPYPEAHFATFPTDLVKPCVLAGTSEKGACAECGAPWERVVERTTMVIDRSERTHPLGRTRSSGTMLEPPTATTTGWRPTCAHSNILRDAPTVPCLVLDPFAGSGTTVYVAKELNRRGLGIELNEKYLELALDRLPQEVLPMS